MRALHSLGTRVRSGVRAIARKLAADLHDLEPEFHVHAAKVRGYTMTSVQRQYALYQAVRFVVANNIPGSFVECGVWRGGSSLLAALTFSELGDRRDIWLYDTFAGMTAPTEFDAKHDRDSAYTAEAFERLDAGDHNEWCYASLEDVKGCLARGNYPQDKLHFVVGDVVKTLPETRPDQISILRLDTDFYESTKAEMEHLYDLLAPGGILIIDDYGGWVGARKAVDEYLAKLPEPVFLARIDETARIAQKR